ncbi:unnamed protein product [Diamesa hyperborea]
MNYSSRYLANEFNGLTPSAESTHISNNSSFLGSQERNQKRRTISPLSNANKQFLRSTSQIEPHVLTDAQSNGIVSRLVKYYDVSQTEIDKNRSVYKYGQFPLVQLKKNEIKFSPQRNLTRSSSVRIAPPNKTIFNRDYRAAILRSNSFQLGSNANVPKLMPIQMRAKDISNRIITSHHEHHMPIVSEDNNYPQSSKSVLDALKEISRKRINNEELILDRSKKICHNQSEVVDSPSSREFQPITPVSAKRNREHDHSPNQRSALHHMDQQRKKLRTKNNALMSSLSSSHFNLRPYSSMPSSPAPVRMTPQSIPETITKIQSHLVVDQRREESESAMEMPISPILPTVAPKLVTPPELPKPQLHHSSPDDENKLHLFNRRYDGEQNNRAKFIDNENDDEVKINFVKPRQKVVGDEKDILRHVEKSKLTMMLNGLSGNLEEESTVKTNSKDTVDAIVDKTKEIPTTTTTEKPVASISFTTTTTTCAIAPIASPALSTNTLTSNLLKSVSSGTGFQLTATSVKPSNESSVGFKLSDSTTLPSSTSVITSPPKSTPVSPLALFSTPGLKTPVASDPKPVFDPSKSLISFTPIAKPTAGISVIPAVSSVPSKTTSNVITAPNGGFSFGSTDATPKTSGFSFGGKTTLTISANAVTPGTTAEPPKAGGFSMGTMGTMGSTTSNTLGSFGSSPSSTAVPASNAPANATGNMFAFGNKAPAATPATTTVPAMSGMPTFGATTAQPAAKLGGVSFGQPAQPETTKASGVGFSFQATQPAAQSTTTAGSTGGFSFQATKPTVQGIGIGFSATAPSTFPQKVETPSAAPSAFAFGQKTNPTTTAPSTTVPSSTFSFGGTTAAPVNPGTGASFSFGGLTAAPAFGGSTAAPVFGGNTAAPTFGGSNPAPTFGGSNPAPTFGSSSAAPTFGASSATPSFGGSSSTPAFGGSSAAPTFGASNATPTFGASSATPSFGGSSSTPAFGGSSAAPAFGSSGSTPAFGGSNATPVFGGSNATPAFGGSSAAPIFGGSNNAPSFGTAQPTPSPSPSNNMFGMTKPAMPAASNVFGSINTASTPQQSSLGNAFGSSSAASPFTNSAVPQQPSAGASGNIFGAAASAAPATNGGMFAFGSSGSSNTTQQQQQTPAASSSGLFNFKSSNAIPTTNPPQNNVFGGSSSNAGDVSVSFTFPKPGGTSSGGNMFGAPQQTQQPSTAPPAYNFGGSAPSQANKTFGFGDTSANNANNGNLFGNSAAPTTAPIPSTNGGFNFSIGNNTAPILPAASGAFGSQSNLSQQAGGDFFGQQQQQQQQQQPPMQGGGLFNIGTTTNQRRPMRTATRRLK